jgi:hypothetical protein
MSKEAKQQGPTLEEIKRMTPEQAEEAIRKMPHSPACMCDECDARRRKRKTHRPDRTASLK